MTGISPLSPCRLTFSWHEYLAQGFEAGRPRARRVAVAMTPRQSHPSAAKGSRFTSV